MSVSWQDRLDESPDVHEVLAVTRDYLATWDRHEIAAIPEPFRPGKVFDANDVQLYAMKLAQLDGADYGDEATPLIRRLTAFFSHAAVRCNEILGGTTASAPGASRPSAR